MLDLQTKQSKVRPTAGVKSSRLFTARFYKALAPILAMLPFASGAWGLQTYYDSQIGTSETPKNLVVTGKLGVGTLSPTNELEVNGSVEVSGSVQALEFIGDGSKLTGLGGDPEGLWSINGSNIFYTNRSVGIGTSSPTQKLEVNGTIKASAFIGDGSGLTNFGPWQTVGDGINYPGGRRVGINRSAPQEALDIYGNIRLGTTELGGIREGTINRVLTIRDNQKVTIGPNNASSDSTSLFVHGDTYIGGTLSVAFGSDLEADTARFNKLYVDNKLISADHSHPYYSDRHLKENIKPIADVLPKLQQVDGVYFNWKQPKHDSQKGRQVGVIAQAVEAQFPELVTEIGDGYKSVAYGHLSAVLIEAVKQLDKTIKALITNNEALESKVTELTARIRALEAE